MELVEGVFSSTQHGTCSHLEFELYLRLDEELHQTFTQLVLFEGC